MKPVVALIDWFGPYDLDTARDAAFDFDDGIYCAIGKTKHAWHSHLQYVGLASNLRARLNGTHHALPLITREMQLWLGEVASPRTPGRKIKTTDRMLDLAEWAHAYFLQLPLNTRKKATPPDRPITVYNKWWRTDFETPYLRRPHQEWPDLIDFLGLDYQAKLVWFGGSQLVQDVEDFVR
ncbi:MAG: hypothetical protein K2V38_11405 [Gemmataceae bacterium]|nr:hypothetical protein [Gemmataceae bacterium]